jgi:hypothetical protein
LASPRRSSASRWSCQLRIVSVDHAGADGHVERALVDDEVTIVHGVPHRIRDSARLIQSASWQGDAELLASNAHQRSSPVWYVRRDLSHVLEHRVADGEPPALITTETESEKRLLDEYPLGIVVRAPSSKVATSR